MATKQPPDAATETRGWRRIVRNFGPAWFSVNMGTGITSILIFSLPYNGRWLYWISVVLFALNVALFLTFLAISVLRYVLYPTLWLRMIRHPTESLFLGTFPMGLATIINMIAFVCVPAWGPPAATLAWALWWIDSAISISTCLFLPFAIMTLHDGVQLPKMTAAWLLPVVAPIVAAASGAIVAETLDVPQHALWTLIVSYILWGLGVPTALAIMVLYMQRLTFHKLPSADVIVSTFLPLGPLGQGSFGIQRLGKVAVNVLHNTGALDVSASAHGGNAFYDIGFVLGLIMWGYALLWIFFALGSISRTRFPFNISWWAFTFPLGVFTTATAQFGADIPSAFFNVLATILTITVTCLWMVVSLFTLRRAYQGSIFVSPCVKEGDDMSKQDPAAKP